MQISPLTELICPLCACALKREAQKLHCSSAHSFDFHRSGYCNLLLVQKKKTKKPGDNAEMVSARSRFLEEGHYFPLAKRAFEILEDLIIKNASSKSISLLDAGCGEGYYLATIERLAQSCHTKAHLKLIGIDISKEAIQAAAKRSKDIAWIVASNISLPMADSSVDLILSLFGFPVWESFHKLQVKNGHVLLVDPGPLHLLEMRKWIYPEVKNTTIPSIDSAIKYGYILEKEETMQFNFTLTSAVSIHDLLAMTPHAYRINKEGEQKLASLDQLEVTADLVIRVLRKSS